MSYTHCDRYKTFWNMFYNADLIEVFKCGLKVYLKNSVALEMRIKYEILKE